MSQVVYIVVDIWVESSDWSDVTEMGMRPVLTKKRLGIYKAAHTIGIF